MSVPALALSPAQNTVAGRVILKESGVGIPNLLVVLFSPQPVILLSGAPPTPDVSGDRLVCRIRSSYPQWAWTAIVR